MAKYDVLDVCQFCHKFCHEQNKTKAIEFYYWRLDVCEKCENTARKNGHIK